MKRMDTIGYNRNGTRLEPVAAADRALVTDPAFELRRNDGLRLIEARLVGFWSVDDAHRYIAAMSNVLQRARLRSPLLLILVDRTAASVQAAPVLALIQEAVRSHLRSGDRLAIACPSALLRRQVDRTPVPGGSALFDRTAAARAWLLAAAPAQGA